MTTGLWKTPAIFSGDWKGSFIPVWEWNNWASPSELQVPYINWHIICEYCGAVDHYFARSYMVHDVENLTVAIGPNPAIDRLTMYYLFSDARHVAVSLVSISGQVVATQYVNSTGSGQVVFDVSGIAAGTYMYNVTSVINTASGVAVIAHRCGHYIYPGYCH